LWSRLKTNISSSVVALNGGGEALTPALNVRDVIGPFSASKSQKIGQIARELTNAVFCDSARLSPIRSFTKAAANTMNPRSEI
jgi:hypothetical protein